MKYLLILFLSASFVFAQGSKILLEVGTGIGLADPSITVLPKDIHLKNNAGFNVSVRVGYEYVFTHQGFFVRYNLTGDSYSTMSGKHLFEGAYLIEVDNHWGLYAGLGLGFAQNICDNVKYHTYDTCIIDSNQSPNGPSLGDSEYKLYNSPYMMFLSNLLLGVRYRHNSFFYVGLEANIGYAQGSAKLYKADYIPDDSKYSSSHIMLSPYTESTITQRAYPFSIMLTLGYAFDLDSLIHKIKNRQ